MILGEPKNEEATGKRGLLDYNEVYEKFDLPSRHPFLSLVAPHRFRIGKPLYCPLRQ
jgi:hypothetical protein